MKPTLRQQSILARLRAVQQEWRVDDLADELNVSPLTIRRDLESLAQEGAIIRTLGGCMAAGRVRNHSYQERVAKNFALKERIGRAAAADVKAGQALILNDGSTTFHLASCLGGQGKITVYTNSVAMIGELARFPDVRLYVLGGEYHPDFFYMGGSLTEQVLETLSVDTVFIGTDSVDRHGRCLVVDQDAARMAQMMMRRGRRKVLLADATKLEGRGGVVYATLKDFDLWITAGVKDKKSLALYKRMTKVKEV